MVVRIVISGKGRGTTGEGEVESEVSDGKRTPTPSFCYSGIDLTDEIKTPTFLAIFVTDSAHKILCVFVTSNVPKNTVKFRRNR